MLLLTRKPGQSIELDLANIDPEMSVGELLANGSIEIHVVGVEESKVQLGIQTRPGRRPPLGAYRLRPAA